MIFVYSSPQKDRNHFLGVIDDVYYMFPGFRYVFSFCWVAKIAWLNNKFPELYTWLKVQQVIDIDRGTKRDLVVDQVCHGQSKKTMHK
jgi:hypothetical protein